MKKGKGKGKGGCKAVLCAMFFCAIALSGCSLTDSLGITAQKTDESGVVSRDLTEEATAVVDSTVGLAQEQGGVVGIAGGLAALVWGLYKGRKSMNALKVAESVISGADNILAKIEEVQKNGGDYKLTKEEALQLLKVAQNDAGTRESVKKLLESQSKTQGWAKSLLAFFA